MADRCALSISIATLALPSSTTAHDSDDLGSSPLLQTVRTEPPVTPASRRTLTALFEAARVEARLFVLRNRGDAVTWLEAA